MERLTNYVTKMTTKFTKAIWCHRAAYAGLSAVYFAGCMGWVDKDTVAQVATALYVAITAQRH